MKERILEMIKNLLNGLPPMERNITKLIVPRLEQKINEMSEEQVNDFINNIETAVMYIKGEN
jgi:hypothetical protein